MTKIRKRDYISLAHQALQNPVLQQALSDMQARVGKATAEVYRQMPEGPGLRDRAHQIRKHAIENLDILLEALAVKIEKKGGKVYFAANAKEAAAYCLEVARRHGVKLAVKGKSMVTEEIGLNRALEAAGIEVVETDLGEYILQLAEEHPSHLIVPAIHKTRGQIGKLFAEKLGIPYSDDAAILTRAARKILRDKFLKADMGISGCNLACAESGHITTVSNEGNIRMATTLPRVHIAFMGMERIVASLEDHRIILGLLPRAAMAQQITSYVSYIGGPAAGGDCDGPEAFHLVILDNGRSRILADAEFREILYCIRCAACLNVCPVYGKIGGHAYQSCYSGPIGAVITPLLSGINRYADLCRGETLCMACRDACPVNIDIPRMLLALRTRLACGDAAWGVAPVNAAEQRWYRLWSMVIANRKRYEICLKGAAAAQRLLPRKNNMIRRLPWPLSGWTRYLDRPAVAGESFVRRFHRTGSGAKR